MKLNFIQYLILGISVLFFCCTSNEKIKLEDVRGVWQAIGNDSIYDEVIICDNDYYLYDERAGDLYFNYKIRNDSLTILQDGRPHFKRKMVVVSNDEFILLDSLFTIRFTRLNAPVDTARLMTLRNWRKTRTYDEEYYSEYIWDLRERRNLWDSLRLASR
jgi:hypothetical protein